MPKSWKHLLGSLAPPSLACLGLGLACAAAAPAGAQTSAAAGWSTSQLIGPARVAARFGTLTSGIRSVEHNRRVGGMPNSYHLLGLAIDVQRRPGVTHQMVEAALRQAGYRLVESLDEIDHSHFAFAPASLARPVAVVPVAKPAVTTATRPAKPLPPPVIADEHGVLLVDSPLSQPSPATEVRTTERSATPPADQASLISRRRSSR